MSGKIYYIMKIFLSFLSVILLIMFIPNSFSNEVTNSSESSFEINIQPYSHYKSCEFLNNCFQPTSLEITSGDAVTWTNYDNALHNVVHVNETTEEKIYFSSKLLNINEKFSFTFESEGIYRYICTIHPWMNGTIFVDTEKIETRIIDSTKPLIFNDDFIVEEYVSGLMVPVNMEFLGDDILILEKNSGKVRHVNNGKLLDEPVLDLEVSNYGEQGLLGITSVDNSVYLFVSEAYHDGGRALENRIYKYTWNGNDLVNPILLKKIPSFEREYLGGELVSDLEGKVYAVTGENYKIGLLQNHPENESYRHFSSTASSEENARRTISDSFQNLLSCSKISFQQYTTNPFGWQSEQPDFSNNPTELNFFNILGNLDSCIRQFSYENFSNGNWKDTSVIIQVEPKNDEYIAIGIRNSFGLAVDPKTGYLWDTENGPNVFDEINLVENKFNSGWAKIQGPSNGRTLEKLSGIEEYSYSEPEFSWEVPVGVSAIEFPTSQIFKKYENFVFVADANNGNIYKFKLDETRTKFLFDSTHLQDNVLNLVNNSQIEPMNEILFASNFGLISDIKFGPDGALYVISLMEGKVYKISS